MKQKIAFAMIMGVITTAIISFTLVSVNIGYGEKFLRIWLRSWGLAYLVAIPAILIIGPLVQVFVDNLFKKKNNEQMIENDALETLRLFKGKEFSASPSPFMHWLKPVVLAAELGKLSFQYLVRKEWTNPMGTLHGGVTAAIVDDVIGATMFSLNEDYFYTTINNVVDYFATARENDTIVADTLVVKKGNQIVHVQCEVWNADKSRLLARGYSNLLKTNLKK